MRKIIKCVFIIIFLLFLFPIFNFKLANASSFKNDNLSIVIDKVSKHHLYGSSTKGTSIIALGNQTKVNNNGKFRLDINNLIYGKKSKFVLIKNKVRKVLYLRLYETKNVNIKNYNDAIKYLTAKFPNNKKIDYFWEILIHKTFSKDMKNKKICSCKTS